MSSDAFVPRLIQDLRAIDDDRWNVLASRLATALEQFVASPAGSDSWRSVLTEDEARDRAVLGASLEGYSLDPNAERIFNMTVAWALRRRFRNVRL
jgi:hypothetical protein